MQTNPIDWALPLAAQYPRIYGESQGAYTERVASAIADKLKEHQWDS